MADWPDPPSHDVDGGEGHDAARLSAVFGRELQQATGRPTLLRLPLDETRIRALLARTAAGDSAAFTALYDETSPYLHAVLLRMLRDREQAAEALQDCYIRIWRRSTTYSPDRGDAAAWLVGIARYRAIDVVRSRLAPAARLAAHASDWVEAQVPPRSPEADALMLTDLDRLARGLEALPEDARRCLLLSFHEGYSHQELADHLGLPLGTVKARIRRALGRLRQWLEAGP